LIFLNELVLIGTEPPDYGKRTAFTEESHRELQKKVCLIVQFVSNDCLSLLISCQQPLPFWMGKLHRLVQELSIMSEKFLQAVKRKKVLCIQVEENIHKVFFGFAFLEENIFG